MLCTNTRCLRNQRPCLLVSPLIVVQERISFSTDLILKYHRRVNDIINVQRHVRGFVARAKMRRLCPGMFFLSYRYGTETQWIALLHCAAAQSID